MDDIKFEGQQEGERILYEAHPDQTAILLSVANILVAIVLMLVLTIAAAIFLVDFRGTVLLVGLMLTGLLAGAAWFSSWFQLQRNVAYVTDRRVIRFASVGPWSTSSRALFWDEVVKIKTSAPNWLYKMLNVGNVVVHARQVDDDLDITNISYYRDLGNYMDKVMYLSKKEPEQLKNVRAFVPKPRGQRY